MADHGVDLLRRSRLRIRPSPSALDRRGSGRRGTGVGAVLRWAAAGCSLRSVAAEIQDAATRIALLVSAIKGFTHMDQAVVAESVDLAQGLGNTVTVLKAKARAKAAAVVVDDGPGLPCVRGFGGELNQVWANLIDNALDAVAQSGRVECWQAVSASTRSACYRQWRRHPGGRSGSVFRPFFTTKPVGRVPAWASTSSGDWSATTTAKSRWSRSRAERSFGSGFRLQRSTTPEERLEQARPAGCRRRPAGARRSASRSPFPVPGALHRHERGIGTGGAVDRPRTEERAATRSP